MSDPNFRKYGKEYHAPPFYECIGKLQSDYEFMRELLKRIENELNMEKWKGNSLKNANEQKIEMKWYKRN